MLKLINLEKDYYVDKNPVKVLKGLNLEFRKKEFVSILGPSGCGKTTLLNIIGGLDRYTRGEMLIDSVTTGQYNDSDWDSYRNNRVGFIFQNYNLIPHLSILDNVQLALTLSGVTKKAREERAIAILERVGLKEHLHKKPNQLSGGQMQRVAIARALINDPEIILADEPTGALDSETSVEIMEILKDISKSRLIIMVTHNATLANAYSTRIVSILDGKITNDTNPYVTENIKPLKEKTKKISMSFWTALGLSFKNLLTKKTRTLITALAGSIGIIGIALSLSLENGFNIYLDDLENNKFDTVPIEIDLQATDLNYFLNKSEEETVENGIGGYEYRPSTKTNIFSDDFLEEVDTKISSCSEVVYYYYYTSRFVNLLDDGNIKKQYKDDLDFTSPGNLFIRQNLFSDQFVSNDLKVLAKKESTSQYQAYIWVNQNGRVPYDVLEFLGYAKDEDLVIPYNEILGKSFRLYTKDAYTGKTDLELKKNYETQVEIEITSIVTSSSKFISVNPGIYYNQEVQELILQDTVDQEKMLVAILMYPKDIASKEKIKEVIADYNQRQDKEENKITYFDSVEASVEVVGILTDSVSIVLIVFSIISLVVSSVMISIITYTSVLERTKEIGILRSIGARKKDIARVFNAEGVMLGFVSGTMGVMLTILLNPILNIILEPLVEYEGLSRLSLLHALFLILVSVFLTLLSGLIPAHMASKKDPVVALRTE